MMAQDCPVIVVGAPRSGTSLVQKIIREHKGFCSVAKESGFIWRPYVHPSKNAWKYEGWEGGLLDPCEILEIQEAFARYALSWSAWRRAAAFNVMRYQRSRYTAPIFRAGYHAIALVNRSLQRGAGKNIQKDRLVDKSVHSPFFLSLIDQVFPDARFVHIVRDGWNTVPSMLDGWLNPSRFFTYDVPDGHQIPDYPHRLWNFALMSGWEELRGQCLANVVCAQWVALQEAALQYFSNVSTERILRIYLEELTTSPRNTLQDLAKFLGLSWSSYFETLVNDLPKVNARPSDERHAMQKTVEQRMARLSAESSLRLSQTNRRLCYLR